MSRILDQGMCELHTGPTASHPRCIIHIDIDCFYAQVETILNSKLKMVPLGITQKQIIVTSNYMAREFGIQKCMQIDNGLKLCPQLVLVNGEDLSKYRKMSNNIFITLQSFGIPVERLGMDENFMDVTELVNEKLSLKSGCSKEVTGHVYGTGEALCPCQCRDRLAIASQIAQEIRNVLQTNIKITCCAGIAHNKLLAKLVCSLFKPNQQTTIFPENGTLLMSMLTSVRLIPGIGTKTTEALNALSIKSVADLQKCEFSDLRQIFGSEVATVLKNLSIGVDISAVKPSNKPQSIGLEDSFKIINSRNAAENKINELLTRLIAFVLQDGRIPLSLRLTVRKHEKQSSSVRSSRQSQIPSNSFIKKQNGTLLLGVDAYARLFTTCLQLLSSVIDFSIPFHITLIGIAFSKFMDSNIENSVAPHLVKDSSIINLTDIRDR